MVHLCEIDRIEMKDVDGIPMLVAIVDGHECGGIPPSLFESWMWEEIVRLRRIVTVMGGEALLSGKHGLSRAQA